MTPAPVLLYCQHLLGLGHAQRAARLARAIGAAGEPVVFVSGGRPVPRLDVGRAELVPLPPLQALDEAASALAGPDGQPPDPAYLAERRAQLLALVLERDPAVVVLELFPFGRHALAFELAPLLLALADDRARRGAAAPRVVVSVRDVLISKSNQAWNELSVLATILQWTDRILVHGSPDLIPFSRTFALADRLGDRLVYTGYLAPPRATAAGGDPHGEVVVSGGGGQVAGPLFRAALDARPLARVAGGRPWRIVLGPYCPPAVRAELESRVRTPAFVASRPGVVIETFREDLPLLLRGAALSVSQAGYNTVLDVVASGVRAVVVPYEGTGDEQPLRARLLAERGLLAVLDAGACTPPALATLMDATLTRPGFPAPARLDLDGADRAAAILREMAARVRVARHRSATRPGGLSRRDARTGGSAPGGRPRRRRPPAPGARRGRA